MHQQLVQWVDDDIEVVQADDSVSVANVEPAFWEYQGIDAKAIPIACFSTVIIKHPLVPVSPTCNWGQGPVFESILPFMGFRQSCFERDPLRFGFNELKRVGGSHGPEEIGW
jgi:hypothetical protein